MIGILQSWVHTAPSANSTGPITHLCMCTSVAQQTVHLHGRLCSEAGKKVMFMPYSILGLHSMSVYARLYVRLLWDVLRT